MRDTDISKVTEGDRQGHRHRHIYIYIDIEGDGDGASEKKRKITIERMREIKRDIRLKMWTETMRGRWGQGGSEREGDR